MTKLATIETNKGTLTVELYPAEAPVTVENFEKLANSGFYNGIKFHRVIPEFVVQGGCPHTKDGKGPVGTGGPGWKIKCETAGNPHKHKVGALSMAHAGKDTGGSQFFINLVDNAFLDHSSPTPDGWGYCVFGKVTEGLETVDKIAKVKTKTVGFHENVPTDMVLITGASRFE